MKKFLLFVAAIVLFAGVAFAAVDVRTDSTVVGKTEKLNFVGPAVTQSGTVITIDSTDHAGDLTVDGEIYGLTNVMVDKSIYLTGNTSTSYGPLWIRQPDGGCSQCGVTAAGTSLTCQDASCPNGM